MLYVCDQNFNRLGIVSSFSYLLWRKRYSSYGEAELHVTVTAKNIELLKKENILVRKDDNEAMYIYYRNIEDTEQGQEILKLKCFSLMKWTDRRTIWNTLNFNATPEDIVRSMIISECISPTISDRTIKQLALAGRKGFGTKVTMQKSYSNVFIESESICNTYEMGIRTNVDLVNRKAFVECYEGANRTSGQNINPRVILSKRFANVISSSFEEANNDYKNTALIGGAGEGLTRKMTSIEQGSGLNRRELFVDAKDIQETKKVNDTDVPLTLEEYILLLKQRGLEKLLEHKEILGFECKLDVTRENTKFNRDFFLGDIITIAEDKVGLTMNSRIEESDEVWQGNQKSIYVKIGESVPTLTKKVQRMVK